MSSSAKLRTSETWSLTSLSNFLVLKFDGDAGLEADKWGTLLIHVIGVKKNLI